MPFRKFDVAKLEGYENTYRVRVGDLRIVYKVDWDGKRILIHYIGPRGKSLRAIISIPISERRKVINQVLNNLTISVLSLKISFHAR